MPTLLEKLTFDTDNTVTITLASLLTDSEATSSTIDNSTDKFMAADIQVKVKTGTGTSTGGKVFLYLLRSVDGGTDFDTFDSADINSQQLVNVAANADDTTYIFSVDTSSVGLLPSHWRLVLLNSTGSTLSAVAADHYIKFTGKKFEIV